MSLARILGKSKGRQSYISDSRWVLPTSFIGLEHEYEGVTERDLPHHTYADFWSYHEEGSLKDNGAEYVFASPLFGVDAYNSLEWLVSHAKTSKWKCTKRTGIHVHLDVRDLAVPQLVGMCILYAAVEPILYRWIGDARDVSHFCIPLYRADEALISACAIIRAAIKDDKNDSRNAVALAEEYQRYAGFNLQALQKFGSVEFRQLQTTHDLNRIVDWINIVMSLKAAAFRLPQSDGAVVRMLERMEPQELLSYIFPERLAAQLYTEHTLKELITLGLPSARDIAVHGCNETSWVSSNFPKGTNKGFIKWLKGQKKVTSKSPVEKDELVDLNWGDPPPPEEEEGEMADEPERPLILPQLGGLQIPENLRRELWPENLPPWREQVNIFNEAPAQVMPEPPPPLLRQPLRVQALPGAFVDQAVFVPPRPRR